MFKKIFAALIAVIAMVNVQAFQFTVPYAVNEADINHYVLKKAKPQAFGVPEFFTVEYQIDDVASKIGEPEGKIQLTAKILGTLHVFQDEVQGDLSFTFHATPYYDAEKGAIFLKDFEISDSSITPEKYMHQFKAIMPLFNDSLAELLQHKPIYVLNTEKTSQSLIKKFAKAIIVEKGQLTFEVEVF